MVKKFPQQRIAFWNQGFSPGAGKNFPGSAKTARGKNTVGNCLREHIGKFLGADIRHKVLAKSFVLRADFPVALFQQGKSHRSELAGFSGQVLRQFLRRRDRRHSPCQKISHKFAPFFRGAILGFNFSFDHARNANPFLFCTVHKPNPIQVVGQQKVGKSITVSRQLLAGLFNVQVYSNVLGLNKPNDAGAAKDLNIRRIAGNLGRFIDGANAVFSFQQFHQRRAVGALAGTPGSQVCVQLPDVLKQSHFQLSAPNAPTLAAPFTTVTASARACGRM
ncbi:MAG: hypothetical protein OXU31_10325 [Gammaproteobacteria bacterium]|nr:hypothetical protein [Gammaproteobacteria bacterium]